MGRPVCPLFLWYRLYESFTTYSSAGLPFLAAFSHVDGRSLVLVLLADRPLSPVNHTRSRVDGIPSYV